MPVKGCKEMVAEANAAVGTVSVEDAMAAHGGGDALFVDVRETQEHAAGSVPGALHVPRGLLEFIADPESPMHKPELLSGRRLVVFCASGGRSALAAKTLKDMGVGAPVNMLGGFAAWREKGGPVG